MIRPISHKPPRMGVKTAAKSEIVFRYGSQRGLVTAPPAIPFVTSSINVCNGTVITYLLHPKNVQFALDLVREI